MAGEWKATTLGECAAWLSGGTPFKGNDAFWSGSIPWVSAKDMKSFRLHDAEDHISPLAVGNGGKLVPTGTILLLVRGMTLHNDVPICIVTREMAFNQDIKALRPAKNVVGEFLAYWLLAHKPDLLASVDHAGHGTGRLVTNTLKEKPVQLPPLAEQKAIAAMLGALDDKIDLNRRMNATLEAMARALFQSWFVDFDPVRAKLDGHQPIDLDPATAALFPSAFQDSEAGHIPKGWSIKPVGEVVDCVGGGTPSTTEPKYWEGGTHHWTTPKDFSSLQAPVLLDTNRKLTNAGIAKISSGLLPAGTLLLSSRAPVGYLAIAAMPVAINQGFIALKCNEHASNFFMLNWCQTNMAEIESRATGTTFAEISKQNFRPIPVVLPPRELMAAFTNIVTPLYSQITANLHQSRTLATLRDSLLPKLLSGALSVVRLQIGKP
jgi:type I restriction enzyme S subunit